MKKSVIFTWISIFIILALPGTCAFAADKDWIGAGDASTWEDGQNWNPQGEPTSADDVTISLKDAYATATRTFEAKTVNVGGAATSTFGTNDFIYGTISPALPSDDALYIRKGGTAVLRGNGIITLKGAFKNTEEALSGEESFMFQLY